MTSPAGTQEKHRNDEENNSNFNDHRVFDEEKRRGSSTFEVNQGEDSEKLISRNGEWKSKFWNWGGLTSKDVGVRKRSQLICGFCWSIVIVLIILLFLVILPAIIQSMVNQSELNVVSSEISEITNTTFLSTTTTSFSNFDGPSVQMQISSVDITWNLQNENTMLKLSQSNTLTVKENGESTLTSTATIKDMETFTDFNEYLMHHESATWSFSGSAYVTYLIKTKVTIDKKMTLKGFSNFTVAPLVQSVNLTEGTPQVLYAKAKVTITSLSDVILTMHQNLYFTVDYKGKAIGSGYIPDFVLDSGETVQDSYLQFSYSNEEEQSALMNLLSYFASGIGVNATMRNFYTNPPITWLAPAFDSVTMEAFIPGMTDPLIVQVNIYKSVNLYALPFTLVLYNPQPIPVTITSLVGNVTYHNTLIAKVNLPSINPPIVIPPYSTVTTPQYISQSYVNSASTSLLASGGGLGNVYAMIGGNFSAFPAIFYYQQLNTQLVIV